MAEEIKNKEVTKKENGESKEADKKRFTINVDSGNGNIFTFSGPEKSSFGLIYDAAHRIMAEVISLMQKRAEDLRTKKPEELKDTTDSSTEIK